jgi:hypothetical protein
MGKLVLATFIQLVISIQALAGDGNIYTLYRGSAAANSSASRIHIATFDANESEEYNRENCFIAAELFMKQPGVLVRYWCEKGRYKQ